MPKYYIHNIKADVKIDTHPKSDTCRFSIGPFDTEELAKAWVDKHILVYLRPEKATVGDIRQPRKEV